jgi:DnaJ-domain-containing protein 1
MHPASTSSTNAVQAAEAPAAILQGEPHALLLRHFLAVAESLYEVLGVTDSANDRDIKRAYRQKALKLHPDVNKAVSSTANTLPARSATSSVSHHC